MLEWYVLKEDFSTREVKPYNCLNNWETSIVKARSKCRTRMDLKTWLRKEFMYHYWSKAECEIQVGGLFASEDEHFKKIDIWYQLEPNLDTITDYIINKMHFRNLK